MKKSILISLLALLTGCSPHCRRAEQLELGCTDLDRNVCETFATPSVCAGCYPDEAWWTFFQDPQLDHLIELSLACHPDIKIAEARILRARQEAIETRSALLPQFSLIGGIAREKLSQFSSQTQGNTTLEHITEAAAYLTSAMYELDIWKKNQSAYYASLNEMFAQIAEFEEAKLLLSGAIASVYLDLQYTLELLQISKERLKAREELYALLKQQFDNGVISEFFLYETDSEVMQIQDQIYQLEASVEVDQHALAALVGNACCTDFSYEPSALFDSPLPLPATLPLDLLARRPDITASRLRIEASCFDVRVARAQFYPQIDLLGFIGFTSFRLTKFFTDAALNWATASGGSLPIYTGQKLEARLGIAQENLEIAIETYNQTLLTAVQQVSDAMTQLTTADRRLAALDRSVSDAQALYRLTKKRFTNGLDSRIAVLNGLENVLIQQEMERRVQLDRFEAAISLIRSIGGGYYAEQ